MAAQAGVPALGGWVYDSDFAYLVGADPEGASFELLLGEPYETDGDSEYARELEAFASTEGRRRSAQALSAWSKTNATSPVAVDAVLKILEA